MQLSKMLQTSINFSKKEQCRRCVKNFRSGEIIFSGVYYNKLHQYCFNCYCDHKLIDEILSNDIVDSDDVDLYDLLDYEDKANLSRKINETLEYHKEDVPFEDKDEDKNGDEDDNKYSNEYDSFDFYEEQTGLVQ